MTGKIFGMISGADVTVFDKGDVIKIFAKARPNIIIHYMGNSYNDLPAVSATCSLEKGIVSMVLPPNLEHGDAQLIAMLSHLAKEIGLNLVLVEPGPGKEFGTGYLKKILKNPKYIAKQLKSQENKDRIDFYDDQYNRWLEEGKIDKTVLEYHDQMKEELTAEKQPILSAKEIGNALYRANLREEQLKEVEERLSVLSDKMKKYNERK